MSEVSASSAQYTCTIDGTPFDVLHVTVYEEISQLFSLRLVLWSDDPAADIESLIRKNATVKVSWGGKEKHYYGLVSSFSQTGAGLPGLGGVDTAWGEYTVEVVPTLWLLTEKTNCRIFQEMSADAIIKKILNDRGLAGKFDPKMKGYCQREYCVQYRETDYAFICRLMEEEGMFFYFTHNGKEMMVIGDDASHFGTCAPEDCAQYKTGTGGLAPTEEYLSGITYSENAYIGKVKFKDFDYREPKKPLKVEKTAEKNTDLEIYDYHPERYRDDGRGRALAEVLKDAEACWRKMIAGTGNWRSASAGCKATISKVYRSDLNGEYVITSVTHTASQQADTGVDYSVSFYAIPSSVTFRPFPANPRPVLNPQTAKVVGPKNAKIFMDKLGRAKVQFHWDLDGKEDDKSSCWIRVAQPYAGIDEETGKKHGFQWHPLVGDEVVVDFLEGDPDKPIIVGSVYNADNSPIVQPSELIRNRILTPYQHQLLLDDKSAVITLNTGGNEHLVMTDKNESDGKVSLATRGDQLMQLEDNSDAAGNVILLSTSDGHKIQLSEKDQAQGIMAKTKNRNRINLDDGKREIKICTQDDNLVLLQDDQRFIEVKTTDGLILRLSDQDKRIELSSVNMHYLVIDDAGDTLVLASGDNSIQLKFDVGSGNVSLSSQSGEISIDAKSGKLALHGNTVEIKADGDLSILAGGNVDIKAGGDATVHADGDATVEGVNVDVDAKANASVSGNAEASLKGQAKASVSGALVDVKGDGIVTISGAVVKIN